MIGPRCVSARHEEKIAPERRGLGIRCVVGPAPTEWAGVMCAASVDDIGGVAEVGGAGEMMRPVK
jgi:hypothetical protein